MAFENAVGLVGVAGRPPEAGDDRERVQAGNGADPAAGIAGTPGSATGNGDAGGGKSSLRKSGGVQRGRAASAAAIDRRLTDALEALDTHIDGIRKTMAELSADDGDIQTVAAFSKQLGQLGSRYETAHSCVLEKRHLLAEQRRAKAESLGRRLVASLGLSPSEMAIAEAVLDEGAGFDELMRRIGLHRSAGTAP